MKAVIAKEYSELIENIESYFQRSDTILHQARNSIRIVEFQGEKFVVKAFKEPNLINKIAYALGKSSKAKKSYEYAVKISDFTPKPIGYSEFYHRGFLKQSYFIAHYFEYDFTIREVLLDSDFPNRETIFKAFANFTKDLHEKNILHHDYSPGNILIKQENDSYTFKIVDINRMSFQTLSQNDRLKNFAKLWAMDSDLEMIIGYYSNNPNDRHIALKYSQAHKDKKNFKKKLKKILKR